MGNFQYNEALANVGNQLASAMLANKKSEMEAQQKAEMHNNILKFLANLQTPQPIQNTYVQPEQTARPQSFGGQLGVSPTATLPQRPMIGSPFVNNQSANQGMADIQGQQKNEAMSNILAGGGGQELATIMQLQKMGQPDWREAGSDQSGRYFYDPSNPTRVLPFTPPVAQQQKPQDRFLRTEKVVDNGVTKNVDLYGYKDASGRDVITDKKYQDFTPSVTVQNRYSGIDNKGVNWDLTGEDFLNTLTKSEQELVRKAANYEIDPSKTTSLRSGERKDFMAKVVQYDPTYDVTQVPNRTKLRTGFGSGKEAQNIRSLNTVAQHIDKLDEVGRNLNNTSSTYWNSLSNWFSKNIGGSSKVTNFETALNAVSNEIVTVFKNTGATDQEIEHIRNTIGSSSSPEQLQGYIQTSLDLIKGRIEALKNQYEQGMGRPNDFKMLDEGTVNVFKKYGVEPPDVNPQSRQTSQQGGMQVFKINGKTYQVPDADVPEFKKDMGIQ